MLQCLLSLRYMMQYLLNLGKNIKPAHTRESHTKYRQQLKTHNLIIPMISTCFVSLFSFIISETITLQKSLRVTSPAVTPGGVNSRHKACWSHWYSAGLCWGAHWEEEKLQ